MGLVIIASIYFLPTLVANARKRDNILAIFLLNLLLGWTLIGWVAALVWAATRSQSNVVYVGEGGKKHSPQLQQPKKESRLGQGEKAVIAIVCGGIIIVLISYMPSY